MSWGGGGRFCFRRKASLVGNLIRNIHSACGVVSHKQLIVSIVQPFVCSSSRSAFHPSICQSIHLPLNLSIRSSSEHSSIYSPVWSVDMITDNVMDSQVSPRFLPVACDAMFLTNSSLSCICSTAYSILSMDIQDLF